MRKICSSDPEGFLYFYVLAGLEEQALKYKSKHARTPVLIIDGVDLVANENTKMYVQLIDQAKYIANARALKIILVSSERLLLRAAVINTRVIYSQASIVLKKYAKKSFAAALITDRIHQPNVSFAS